MKTSRIIRFIISAYFLVFVSCFSYAQIGIKWQKHFGGTGIDESPNIQKTPDGNLLLVFGSKSRDYDCVGNHGGTDVFLPFYTHLSITMIVNKNNETETY